MHIHSEYQYMDKTNHFNKNKLDTLIMHIHNKYVDRTRYFSKNKIVHIGCAYTQQIHMMQNILDRFSFLS